MQMPSTLGLCPKEVLQTIEQELVIGRGRHGSAELIPAAKKGF